MSKIVHIIKPKHKRIFYSFLKVNDALAQFKRNCRYRGRDVEWFTPSHDYYFEDVIDYAFIWSEQPEGGLFWQELHRKWKKYIQQRMNI